MNTAKLLNGDYSIHEVWEYSALLDELPASTRLKVIFNSGNTRYGYAIKHEGIGYYLSPRGATMGYRLDGVRSIEKKENNNWIKVWEKQSV